MERDIKFVKMILMKIECRKRIYYSKGKNNNMAKCWLILGIQKGLILEENPDVHVIMKQRMSKRERPHNRSFDRCCKGFPIERNISLLTVKPSKTGF